MANIVTYHISIYTHMGAYWFRCLRIGAYWFLFLLNHKFHILVNVIICIYILLACLQRVCVVVYSIWCPFYIRDWKTYFKGFWTSKWLFFLILSSCWGLCVLRNPLDYWVTKPCISDSFFLGSKLLFSLSILPQYT